MRGHKGEQEKKCSNQINKTNGLDLVIPSKKYHNGTIECLKSKPYVNTPSSMVFAIIISVGHVNEIDPFTHTHTHVPITWLSMNNSYSK